MVWYGGMDSMRFFMLLGTIGMLSFFYFYFFCPHGSRSVPVRPIGGTFHQLTQWADRGV